MKKLTENQIATIKKILIIQYKPFGDILLNTAYLPALRKRFPDAEINFLVQKPYKTLLEDNPILDNLVLMEKKKGFAQYIERIKVIKLVRKSGYDLIIDELRGTGSAQITLFSGAKFRLGWKLKRWNWVYNLQEPRENIRYYGLLKFDSLKPLGIEAEIADTYYKIKEKSQEKIDKWLKEVGLEKKRYIVVSPGTPVLVKQWSLDSYAIVCDRIQRELRIPVVMMWGPGEMKDVDYIMSKMKTKPVVALPTTFNEAAAMLYRSKMFFGNDGGINHVAIAENVPSLAIFGPHSNPKKWQAWHKEQHVYLRNWDCKDKYDRTLGITPEFAFKQFKKLLGVI